MGLRIECSGVSCLQERRSGRSFTVWRVENSGNGWKCLAIVLGCEPVLWPFGVLEAGGGPMSE